MTASPERDDSPAGCGLPRDGAAELARAGFDLAGVLSAARYDELVPVGWRCRRLLPTARSAVVLACGGRGFEHALRGAPEASDPRDPVDRFTRRSVLRAAEAIGGAGWATRAFFYFDRLASDGSHASDGDFVDLIALARASGLGEPGRLRVLLHPRFGPWLAIRALLLSEAELEPTPPLAGFDPCRGCPAPCAAACRGAAFSESGLQIGRCIEYRLREPECTQRCASRRACVIGPHHAYDPAMEAHYMRASLGAFREAGLRAGGASSPSA